MSDKTVRVPITMVDEVRSMISNAKAGGPLDYDATCKERKVQKDLCNRKGWNTYSVSSFANTLHVSQMYG